MFYSEAEIPNKKHKLFGLEKEQKLLLSFCHLVWSKNWLRKKELYSLNPTIMLYGSPGTGKTSLLQNTAVELQLHDVKYFTFSLEKLLHKDLGRSSENLRSLFEFIRSESEKEKKLLIHFDDVDSVLSSRTIENESSGVRRFVNTFIKELDVIFFKDYEFPPVFSVTTNIRSAIDSAVKRRFSLNLPIENNVSLEEFKLWLVPIMTDLELESGMSYDNLYEKMKSRNLKPYDVFLIVQRLMLEKISDLVVNGHTVELAFEEAISSGNE